MTSSLPRFIFQVNSINPQEREIKTLTIGHHLWAFIESLLSLFLILHQLAIAGALGFFLPESLHLVFFVLGV